VFPRLTATISTRSSLDPLKHQRVGLDIKPSHSSITISLGLAPQRSQRLADWNDAKSSHPRLHFPASFLNGSSARRVAGVVLDMFLRDNPFCSNSVFSQQDTVSSPLIDDAGFPDRHQQAVARSILLSTFRFVGTPLLSRRNHRVESGQVIDANIPCQCLVQSNAATRSRQASHKMLTAFEMLVERLRLRNDRQ